MTETLRQLGSNFVNGGCVDLQPDRNNNFVYFKSTNTEIDGLQLMLRSRNILGSNLEQDIEVLHGCFCDFPQPPFQAYSGIVP
jgi:hypothetical protein